MFLIRFGSIKIIDQILHTYFSGMLKAECLPVLLRCINSENTWVINEHFNRITY